MTRGRRAKPTALKELAGNPGKRPLNQDEPRPEPILPPAPDELKPVGVAKWNQTALKLYNQGILTELDVDLLYLYCLNYQEFIDAQAQVAQSGGPVVRGTSGAPFQNPYKSISNQCQERMIKIMSMMGMSPADRAKVHANPKPAPESLAEKFFGATIAAKPPAKAKAKAPRRKEPAEPARRGAR